MTLVRLYALVYDVHRYKYLQRPLEESSLPGLFQYCNRWPVEQRDKFAIATGLIMSSGLSTTASLQNLAKDHLVKDSAYSLASVSLQLIPNNFHYLIDLALNVVTVIFRTYLLDQTMEHLGSALRKGGVKDLLLFLPTNKRDPKSLEEHFKKAGLPQVAEWFIRRQSAAARDSVVKTMKELCEDENRSNDEVLSPPRSIDGFILTFRLFRSSMP